MDDVSLKQIVAAELFPLHEVATCIVEIKQVEFYTTWRKLIPTTYEYKKCS